MPNNRYHWCVLDLQPQSLSVACPWSVVLSGFFYHLNWSPWYGWNIAVHDVKTPKIKIKIPWMWRGFVVFNATFKKYLAWRSVLLVEKTEVPWENHWPAASVNLQHRSNEIYKARDHMLIYFVKYFRRQTVTQFQNTFQQSPILNKVEQWRSSLISQCHKVHKLEGTSNDHSCTVGLNWE